MYWLNIAGLRPHESLGTKQETADIQASFNRHILFKAQA